MAVSYTVTHAAGGDSFAAGKPGVWAETRLLDFGDFSTYDLSPDCKRLAAMLADNTSAGKGPTHLTFLLNFFDELRRRAPASK